MKTDVRIPSIILLLINGAAAIFGGGYLLADPTGGSLGLPPSWMVNMPFSDYFIPGLILFLVIGVGNVVTAFLVMFRNSRSSAFIILQGLILCGWIAIQIYMLQDFHFLHIIFGGIGFLMFALGMIMADREMVVGEE